MAQLRGGRDVSGEAALARGEMVAAFQPDRPGPSFEGGEFVIDLRPNDPVVDLRPREPSVLRYRGRAGQLRVKRGIDIVGAVLAILIFSPVFLATAVAVASTSRGPVFFRQQRVGQFGHEFRFVKFRSMYTDAEERKAELETLNLHHSGPIFKMRSDPRITPIGRILRKLSIDELPQLFHVLTGKMSLVGPRPPIPTEVAQYTPYQYGRLLAKPGITCIWQVSGRSELDFDTWVDMDIDYIANWNLWLDMELLAKTIPAVLSGRGAY